MGCMNFCYYMNIQHRLLHHIEEYVKLPLPACFSSFNVIDLYEEVKVLS